MLSNQRGGEEVYREGYFRGLRPEPELWVDEWADRYMRIPRALVLPSLVHIGLNEPHMRVSRCAACHRHIHANVWSLWWPHS